jgi:hypothetical protein
LGVVPDGEVLEQVATIPVQGEAVVGLDGSGRLDGEACPSHVLDLLARLMPLPWDATGDERALAGDRHALVNTLAEVRTQVALADVGGKPKAARDECDVGR